MRYLRKALGILSMAACSLGCEDEELGAACFKPPYVARDGLAVVACEEDREWGVVLPGTKLADRASAAQFLDAHRAELHTLGGIVTSGVGSCCHGGEWQDPNSCIVVGTNACSHHADELIELFRGFQASSDETRDVGFQLLFEIQGWAGPRCEERECGPEPYHAALGAQPSATRTLLEPAERDDANCSHDGECVITGCGNGCDHWTNTGRAGACEYRDDLKEAFCGCLDRRCVWFE